MVEELDEELDIVQRYEDYLSGSVDYTYIRIPKAVIVELVSVLLKFSRKKIEPAPEYTNKDILYYIIKTLL